MLNFSPKGVFESERGATYLERRYAHQREMRSNSAMLLHGLYIGLYSFWKYFQFPYANIVRYAIIKLFSRHIRSSSIADGVMIWFPWNVKLGENSTLNQGVIIDGFGGVEIGKGVRIAAYTCINTADHRFENPDVFIKDQGYEVAGVKIEDDVWLGSGVKVSKGITIGEGSVVGAGSVVTKDISPYSIAVGIPCKVIGSRKKTN